MIKFRQLLQVLGLLFSSMLLIGAIVFAESKHVDRTCQGIEIKIDKGAQNLIQKEALLALLNTNTSKPILSAPLQSLDIRGIENTMKTHSFVREGIAYKNWRGILKIIILSRRPIARVFYPSQKSQYIDEGGTFLPLSDQHTARVLLTEVAKWTEGSKNLQAHTDGTALLALLSYINQDPFWRAQIAYLQVNKEGKITMTTQVSKQRIEFGRPEDIEKKFAKLKLFYKQIVPYKGWNTYKRVNLEFEDQIVCE